MGKRGVLADTSRPELASRPELVPAPGPVSGPQLASRLELAAIAVNLAMDSFAARITASFAEQRIPTVLLKGPSIADWLYDQHEVRAYTDVDLLVSPDDWRAAQAVLQSLGFRDHLGPLDHPRMQSYSGYPWVHGRETVDLHSTLTGVGAPPSRVWQVLIAHTESKRIGGSELRVLTPEGRLMHIALHAAQHGPKSAKSIGDLERALMLLPFSLWSKAADLARRLDATPAFAAGLQLSATGKRMVAELGLEGARSVQASLAVAPVPLALGLEHLRNTPGTRAKVALLSRELVPNPSFMRWWSPLARRGRLGLAASYAWRPLWLTWRLVPGFLAWRRAARRSI